MPHSEGGPCCAVVGEEDDGSPQLCGETWSTCWYGKKGKKFCAGHRAAWNHWRHSGDADEEVEHSTLTDVDELLGVRYCEPITMKGAERYNDIAKNNMQYCVQGTFTVEGYARGHTDTRWQKLDELVECCTREDFEKQTKAYLKELEKTFKRDAKRLKTAAQWAK